MREEERGEGEREGREGGGEREREGGGEWGVVVRDIGQGERE